MRSSPAVALNAHAASSHVPLVMSVPRTVKLCPVLAVSAVNVAPGLVAKPATTSIARPHLSTGPLYSYDSRSTTCIVSMSRTTFVLTRILLLTRLDAGTLQDLLCALFIDDDRGHVNVVPAAHHIADGLLAHAQLQLVLSSRDTSSALCVVVAQCVGVLGLCEGVAT